MWGGVGELGEDLCRDGALTGDGPRVVEGGDLRGSGLQGERAGEGGCVVVGVAVDDNVDGAAAERGDPLALLARCRAGEVNGGAHAGARAREGDALRVVARARAGDTGGALCRRQLCDEVVGAAGLVRSDVLEVLALEPDIEARQRRQALRPVQRRTTDHALEAGSGLVHFARCHGHVSKDRSPVGPHGPSSKQRAEAGGAHTWIRDLAAVEGLPACSLRFVWLPQTRHLRSVTTPFVPATLRSESARSSA